MLVPLAFNSAYFHYMNKKNKPLSTDHIYSWRYGQIRYSIKGKGEPLLLIHGIYPGADRTEWQNAEASFCEAYQVYMIDLIGFGYSSKPDISYSAYLYIRLINDFIRDVIKQPVLVAASGYSAAYSVMGYIFNPDLYKKFILISPTGIKNGYIMPVFKDYVRKHLLETPLLGTAAYIFLTKRGVARKLFSKQRMLHNIAAYTPSVISPSAFYGGSTAKLPISALICKYLNVKITDKLNRIKIPTLILKRDSIGFNGYSKCLEEFLKD